MHLNHDRHARDGADEPAWGLPVGTGGEAWAEDPQPVWLIDAQDLRLLAVNRAALALSGRPGSAAAAWLSPEDASGFAQQVGRAAAGPALPGVPGSWRVAECDGGLLDVRSRMFPFGYEGRPAVLALLDVPVARHGRTHAEGLMSRALECTSEGVMITDAELRIVRVNGAFTALTGFTAAEVLGKRPGMLKSGAHDSAFYRNLWEQVRTQGYWQGELTNRRKDGSLITELLSITALSDRVTGGITHYVGIFADISDMKQARSLLEYQASHDPLTRLPNRTLFGDRLRHAIDRSRRSGLGLAVLFVDLDNFKFVNDSLGHEAGDEFLSLIAERLLAAVRESDTLARMGGDEFAVLTEDAADPTRLAILAERIVQSLADPIHVDGHEICAGASVGISLYPDNGTDAASLLKHADIAMYRAKERGRNQYQFFSEDMRARATDALLLGSSLRACVERGELFLLYQPRVALDTGRATGTEALLRWRHPTMGVLGPDRFIHVAEASGLIVPIGEWVLRAACLQAMQWQEKGWPCVRMAVNLSPRQFREHDLADRVRAILAETGLEAGWLELEITEGMVMDDPEQARLTLSELKALGVSVSIDDFGTGYSSLSYLKRFPIDGLKVDKSFVRDIPGDADSEAITRAIVSLGRSLGLTLIAEGVETEAQRDFLRDTGCEQAQGYLFARPLAASEVGLILAGAAPLREGADG